MNPHEVKDYALLVLNRATKLGVREVFWIGEKFVDFPEGSSKANEMRRKHPRGVVGVYNKSAGLKWIEDDLNYVLGVR